MTYHPPRPTGRKIDVKAFVARNAKRWPALLAALSVAGCTSTPAAVNPVMAQAQARATYKSVCGEVLRLRDAGKPLPSAIKSCIQADDLLDAADQAYALGQVAQATSGTQRALVIIAAAQAAVVAATNGSVK